MRLDLGDMAQLVECRTTLNQLNSRAQPDRCKPTQPTCM